MASYRYKARGAGGIVRAGIMEAVDEQMLLELLRQKGLYCYQYDKVEEGRGGRSMGKLKPAFIPPFCRQMAVMLSAGIPVSGALLVCCEAAQDRGFKRLLTRLNENVQKGRTLSEAMAEMEGAFPDLLVRMVETGEASGTLDHIMEKMAAHYSREAELVKKVQGAMTYPIILMAVTVFSTAFMLTTVLPQFTTLLSGAELPALTRFLLEASDLLKTQGMLILFACLGFAGFVAWLLSVPPVRLEADRLRLCLPVLGPLLKIIYTARFASAFSLLYGSGIRVLASIDAAAAVMGNTYVRACLAQVGQDLRKGELLSQALKKQKLFPPVFISTVMAGEEAGGLEQVLAEVGEFYEKESLQALEHMITLLEPLMMIVMALIVGSIAVAVMMPVYSMYSGML